MSLLKNSRRNSILLSLSDWLRPTNIRESNLCLTWSADSNIYLIQNIQNSVPQISVHPMAQSS